MIRLLISDLHLAKERPAVTRAFFRFMEQETVQADELYILGDLFEAWIGDDDPGALARAVVAGLRKLSDSGTRVYFLHGNRDFLVGRRFARQTGCTLLPSYHCITSGNQKLLLCHGDTLCTGDREYQRYRRRVRNPLVRWVLSRLPLGRRLRIAADWRARSQAANSNKPDNIMDVTPAEVERQLAAHDAVVLIHGHTHRPGIHHHDNGDRVVLGDWDKLGWYVRIEGEELDLNDFPIGTEPPRKDEQTDGPADRREDEWRDESAAPFALMAAPFELTATDVTSSAITPSATDEDVTTPAKVGGITPSKAASEPLSPSSETSDKDESGDLAPSQGQHSPRRKNLDSGKEIQLSLDL